MAIYDASFFLLQFRLDVVAYRVLEFSDCVDPQKALLNNGAAAAAADDDDDDDGTLDISGGGAAGLHHHHHQQYFVISNDANLGNGTVYVNAANGAIITATAATAAQILPNKSAAGEILIAPKPDAAAPSSSSVRGGGGGGAPLKRRDDRRRTTHNEVERRRRDKINTGIMQLGSIIPADGVPDSAMSMDRPNVANAVGQSKSGILTKACEYIEALHNEVNK